MSIANIIIILVVVFVLYLYINDYIQNTYMTRKIRKEIEETARQMFAGVDEAIRQDLIDLDQALKEQQVVRHLTHCPKCFDLYFDDEPHKCKMFKGKIFNVKFFNRILTEKEIIKIYKKSKWKTKMTSILRMLHPKSLLRSR